MKLIVATFNQGKVKEIKAMLENFDEVLSLKDIGFEKEAIEDGKTFLENATKKALFYYKELKEKYPNFYFLADDSGLEVEALDGKPGVYSARYAGEKARDKDNIQKLLEEMKDIPFDKRDANFNCTMVLVYPNGEKIHKEGKCYGKIAFSPRGENGFGYDPIFLTSESNYQKTMAELSKEEKNLISHRRKALEEIKNELKR
ncbi:MAG: XTP/dITP diphosphatase [Brevinematales bacterium]|nr:XTP/dITP diphosphatase [Brevinematales bacterium]